MSRRGSRPVAGRSRDRARGQCDAGFRLPAVPSHQDVVGQAVLGAILFAMALGVAVGVGWTRWVALAYALTFGLVVMPVWVLAVLIPLPPRPPDYAFTVAYWLALGVIAVAAIAA